VVAPVRAAALLGSVAAALLLPAVVVTVVDDCDCFLVLFNPCKYVALRDISRKLSGVAPSFIHILVKCPWWAVGGSTDVTALLHKPLVYTETSRAGIALGWHGSPGRQLDGPASSYRLNISSLLLNDATMLL
jgi:hypothetical protein